ncbi:cell division protein FtsZ [Selenomonas sp. FC4001]|uniref:cell division protein FtsZ n=1 Tax=Selenomonas sp. FC4001 TaxID=1408313 RepID=UPI00068F7B90|nr:cell division protein FtsZ [Selenomonas sp. FC4001]
MTIKNENIANEYGKAIVNIKIVGAGGGGTSVLESLAANEMFDNIEMVAVNTDARSLCGLSRWGISSIQVGNSITNGYGTGGDRKKGELAAIQDEKFLREMLNDTNMLFITAGLGGGAGSGIAPVIAKLAKEQAILTVAIVTMPFSFEGGKRNRTAMDSLRELEKEVDALIVIQNDKLMTLPEAKKLTISNAFKLTDSVLERAVTLITKIIMTTGDVNIDFADISTILRQSQSSDAVFAVGASEKGDVAEALEKACNSPLLKRSVKGAQGAILYIIGADDMSMYDINTAIMKLKAEMTDAANIIWGYMGTPDKAGTVEVMLIATDFIDC